MTLDWLTATEVLLVLGSTGDMRIDLQLPTALKDETSDAQALDYLRDYYHGPPGTDAGLTGSAFDTWDSTQTRSRDADRFTADDLVAITFLSVRVPGLAAQAILRELAQTFTDLLTEIGADRDLVDEPNSLDGDDDWAGWRLRTQLKALDGIGTTTATKLMARKRPRLRPIWDTVVAQVMGAEHHQWEPLRLLLRADGCRLHERLLRLRADAGLPEEVSALRVLDVVAWQEGREHKVRARPDLDPDEAA